MQGEAPWKPSQGVSAPFCAEGMRTAAMAEAEGAAEAVMGEGGGGAVGWRGGTRCRGRLRRPGPGVGTAGSHHPRGALLRVPRPQILAPLGYTSLSA